MFVTCSSDRHVSVAVAAIIRVTDHLFRILSSLLLYKNINIKYIQNHNLLVMYECGGRTWPEGVLKQGAERSILKWN